MAQIALLIASGFTPMAAPALAAGDKALALNGSSQYGDPRHHE